MNKLLTLYFLLISLNLETHDFQITSIYDLLPQHPEIEYIKCHDAQSYAYTPLPVVTFAELRSDKGLMAETFILKIPHGQVASVNGFIKVGNNILEESIPPFCTKAYHEEQLHKTSFKNIKKITGRVAVLTMCFDLTYGHWIFNILARLALLEMYGVEYDWLYVAYDKPYMKETLTLWGINPAKIITPFGANAFIQADELIVPSHLGVRKPENHQYVAPYIPLEKYYLKWGLLTIPLLYGNIKPTTAIIPENIALEDLFFQWNPFVGINYYRADIINYIKNKFIPLLQNKSFNFSKKVFISRQDISRRSTNNEDEIFTLFEQKGFKRYCLTGMPYLEQVALFHNAQIIVGPQGSGLLNILYCNPNATVIEIFQSQLCSDLYFLFQTLHLDTYKFLTTISLENITDYYSQQTDMPIDIIKNFLETL